MKTMEKEIKQIAMARKYGGSSIYDRMGVVFDTETEYKIAQVMAELPEDPEDLEDQ